MFLSIYDKFILFNNKYTQKNDRVWNTSNRYRPAILHIKQISKLH